MRSERRVLLILIVVVVLAAPAAVLRALCLGRSCAEETAVRSSVPFCSLPAGLRDRIAAGYRESRSPDILAVTRADVRLSGGTAWDRFVDAPWPTVGTRVPKLPLLFYGTGVAAGTRIPAGIGLDDISPTVAEIIGFDIPHPEVRSGRPIAAVANGERPRLVVIVLLKGFRPGMDILARRTLSRYAADGAVSPEIDPGSLPLDRAALIATIGTGGLPFQHGTTGTIVRDDDGKLTTSWSKGFPGTVIATLSDDLDEVMRQRPKIGLVAGDLSDKGVVGGNWYVDVDKDEFALPRDPHPRFALRLAESMLLDGFGDDDVPDVLAVGLQGSFFPRRSDDLDAAVGNLWRMAERASRGSATLVVTGLPRAVRRDLPVGDVVRDLHQAVDARVVLRAVPGGFFLDQSVLSREHLTKDQVVSAFRKLKAPGGDPLFADVFPGIAVSLGEFC